MDTTNSSRELHLTVANEDYLECMVRIESEEGRGTTFVIQVPTDFRELG